MVITFDNSDNAVQAFELLRVSHYEDKKMLGKIKHNGKQAMNIIVRSNSSMVSSSELSISKKVYS